MKQPRDRGWRVGRELRPVGFALDDARQNLGHRVTGKRHAAGPELVEHGAKGPDVGASISGAAFDLFRRHVRRRAEQGPDARRGVGDGGRIVGRSARDRIERLREAEVEDFDRPVRAQNDVLRLQVAVNDVLIVRRFERVGQLARDRQRVDLQRAAARRRGTALRTAPGDDRRQRRAVDELHDQRQAAAGVLDAVDLRDVRMVQRGEDLGFALEARQPFLIGSEGRGKDLDRNAALQPGIARAVDLAHSAGAEQRVDVVDADAGAWGERHA